MEELLGFLIELVGTIFFDFLFDRAGRSDRAGLRALASTLFTGLLGAAVGALSLAIWPHYFIRTPALRLALLCTTPVLNGLVMVWLGHHFERKERPRSTYERFLPAFLFALCFSGVRYLWAGT